MKIKEWKQLIKDLITSAEEILSQHLLFLEDGSLPEVDLDVIDNPSNHEAGHYFALDEGDAWKKTWEGMIGNLRKSPRIEKMVKVQGWD